MIYDQLKQTIATKHTGTPTSVAYDRPGVLRVVMSMRIRMWTANYLNQILNLSDHCRTPGLSLNSFGHCLAKNNSRFKEGESFVFFNAPNGHWLVVDMVVLILTEPKVVCT